jgi:CubicO group peptidase (beta-lactamase class C family)
MTLLRHPLTPTWASVPALAITIALGNAGARSQPQGLDAQALDAQVLDAYDKAFDAWVAKHRPTTAIAAVRRRGETVFLKGHNADPRAPSLIGSMSKPITGVCVATLIRDGKLSFTTPLAAALAGFFRRHGPPADRRLERVTIEQLLTHRSGLLGNDEGDPMQAMWRDRAAKGLARIASPEPLLTEHFKHPLAYEPGSHGSYTNTGFIVLSAVIEEASGKPYETYCREAAFAPLGITSARLHPDWATFSGARGWIVTAEDYLAFLDVFDPKQAFLGDRVKAWIAATETRWDKDYRGQFEGLGIVTAITPAGWHVMHSGILNFTGKAADGRLVSAVIHSHAYREPSGFSAFHAMTPAEENSPVLGELDEVLHRVHERALKR